MDNHENSFEPMDIDISSQSNQPMDISFNNSGIKIKSENVDIQSPPAENISVAALAESTPLPATVKKYHIIRPKENKNIQINLTIKIVISIIVPFLAMVSYQFFNIKCSDNLNVEVLRSNLASSLFGQYRAIDMLVEGLKAKEKSKILFLYGGTGVGKTYTTSIILNEVGYHSNIYHYTMPSFMDTFSTDFMVGLAICHHSIVIIDDLTLNFNIFDHIKNLIEKSEDLEKNITIILVYSCKTTEDMKECDALFPAQLLRQFKQLNVYKKLVKFETLQQEHLQKCIEHELQRDITDIEFLKFLRNFNVTVDGCKGVHHKIKHLNIY